MHLVLVLPRRDSCLMQEHHGVQRAILAGLLRQRHIDYPWKDRSTAVREQVWYVLVTYNWHKWSPTGQKYRATVIKCVSDQLNDIAFTSQTWCWHQTLPLCGSDCVHHQHWVLMQCRRLAKEHIQNITAVAFIIYIDIFVLLTGMYFVLYNVDYWPL